MGERDVRVYTHASNRATVASKDRKVTFKSALDTPFRIPWPIIPMNMQNELLTHLISILEGVADYQIVFRRLSRKRKRGNPPDEVQAEEKEDVISPPQGAFSCFTNHCYLTRNLTNLQDSDTRVKSIVDHLVVGLNAVTKRLEEQVRKRPHSVTITKDGPTADTRAAKPDLCLVLACRADIDPPLLIDHLPHLIASCNAIQKESVRLASLPEGAEGTLAKSLGIRRVTVIGFDGEFPVMDGFKRFFESMPILSAPWLSNIRQARDLIPTHVKQVKTSAPRDMKAAKEERKKGRALAKQRKRIKIR
ncbi:hypothetical protein AX14_001231 [Amanita brunnescens Koide BX004]|nr:hypothetical protein AX14_001231 [Amanita brunnescens Koide BX004]